MQHSDAPSSMATILPRRPVFRNWRNLSMKSAQFTFGFRVTVDHIPPLQHLNQKTEAQKENLRLKREYAQKEYKGAIELARYANPKGSQIHFELSERCEAWNLPFVREFLDELQLRKVTCHGCTVGLRANDTGDLLCKGWSIASRNNNLLRHLHLPCQKNHKKVPCESGRPAKTAFYTPVFVKKVIEALRQCESWSLVTSELQELPTIQKPFDTTEECQVQDVEVSAEEKLRITKLLKHIHSTGSS